MVLFKKVAGKLIEFKLLLHNSKIDEKRGLVHY